MEQPARGPGRLSLFALLLFGCPQGTLEGRPCDAQQRCLSGYVCDVARNLCVSSGAGAGAAGAGSAGAGRGGGTSSGGADGGTSAGGGTADVRPSATNSLVTVTPATIAADGRDEAQIVVTVLSSSGAAMAGVNVTLTISVPAQQTPVTPVTDSGGQAIFLVRSATPGVGVITAVADGVQLASQPTVTFGANSQAISGTISGLTAPGLVLRSPGQSDLPVPAGASSFAFSMPQTAGSTYDVTVLAQPQGLFCLVTNGAGTVSASPPNITVACARPAADPTRSQFIALPVSAVADGVDQIALAVSARDAQDVPLRNELVTFTVVKNGVQSSAGNTVTNSNGLASAGLSSTEIGPATATATFGGISKSVQVTFTAGPPTQGNSALASSLMSAFVNESVTLTVTARDARGNLIAGQAVSMSSSGTGNTFTPPSGMTGSNGEFQTVLTTTTPEVKTVTAMLGSVGVTAMVTFLGPVTVTTSATDTDVSVSWSLVTGATYEVRRGPSPSGPFTVIGTSSAPPLQDPGRPPLVSGYYVVRPILPGPRPGPDSTPVKGTAGRTILCVSSYIGNRIAYFGSQATGNVGPIRAVQGTSTLMNLPIHLSVDPSNALIFAPNSNGNHVAVWPFGATGNVAPARVITGAATLLSNPGSAALDPARGELYVANNSGSQLLVFSSAATGNVAPLRSITGLSDPLDAEFDPIRDEVYVLLRASSSIRVYRRTDVGAATPLRTIAGAATTLAAPFGLALDLVNDELVVASRNNNSIVTFPRTANGNVAPLRTIVGASTQLNGPSEVMVDDERNELFVANYSGNSVTVYPRTANGNVGPLRAIAGTNTGFNEPASMVFCR